MKNLQFDYIQLICIVLPEKRKLFIFLKLSKGGSAQLRLRSDCQNRLTLFCTIFHKTGLVEQISFVPGTFYQI
ncbi:hypothetical protein VB776_05915 [Arcicella sp. DC2W]|uniref:Uncharacterized protein n=1 Tax=Arcicella gelida TaxID=2984195 RepID=A0ABU5S201_9BACT|nr:hypothetical protein [Arcicella sp. DC2W]MEA5402440.1 hypothetical protein [Arcicella sp. DC2W]